MKMRSLELSLWLSSVTESVTVAGGVVDDMLAEMRSRTSLFQCLSRE